MSNGIFAKHSLEENIALIKSLGFENIEFSMKSVEKQEDDSPLPAKEVVSSSGLSCLTLHAASLHVQREEEISTAKYYNRVSLDFARALNAKVMVVHSNVSRRLSEGMRRSFLEKTFGEMALRARKLGVKLALENLSYSSTGFGKNVAEIEEALRIIDRDSIMGITLDSCHAEATGQTLKLLKKYGERIWNVHVSDRAHKPFEKETPNLRLLMKTLASYSYNGPITMELSKKCSIEEILRTKRVVEEELVNI